MKQRIASAGIILLAGMVLLTGWACREPSRKPAMKTAILKSINLRDQARSLMDARQQKIETTYSYFFTDFVSVFMHVMDTGQFCPAHIHRGGYECTVVVRGEAEMVSHFNDGSGGVESRRERVPTGDLFISPPFTGHECINVSNDELLAALVISSPPFTGNLYIREDNEFTSRGDTPTLIRTADYMGQDPPADSGVPGAPLPFNSGVPLTLLHVDGTHDTKTGEFTLFYITGGRGSFTANSTEKTELLPGQAVFVRPSTTVRITTATGETLTILELAMPHEHVLSYSSLMVL